MRAQHLRRAETDPGLGGYDDAATTEVDEPVLAVADPEKAVAEVAGQRLERRGAPQEAELVGVEPAKEGLGEVLACVVVATPEHAHRAVSHLGGAAGDGVVEQVEGGGPSARASGEDPGVGVAEGKVVAVSEQVERLAGPEPQVRRTHDLTGDLGPSHVDRGRRPAADHEVQALVRRQQQPLEQASDTHGGELVEVVDHDDQRGVTPDAHLHEGVPVGCPGVLGIGGMGSRREALQQGELRVDGVRGPPGTKRRPPASAAPIGRGPWSCPPPRVPRPHRSSHRGRARTPTSAEAAADPRPAEH